MIAPVVAQPRPPLIEAASCLGILNKVWTAVRDFFEAIVTWIKSFCSQPRPLPLPEDPNAELERHLARYNNLPMEGDAQYLKHVAGIYTQSLFPPHAVDFYVNLEFNTEKVARLAVLSIVFSSDNLQGREPLPFMQKHNQMVGTPLGAALEITSPVPFLQALRLKTLFGALSSEEKRGIIRHLSFHNIDGLPLSVAAKNILKAIRAIGEGLIQENPLFNQALREVR